MLLFKTASIFLVMATLVLMKTSGYFIDFDRGYHESVLAVSQTVDSASIAAATDAVKISDKTINSMSSALKPTATTITVHPSSTDRPQPNGNNTSPMVDYGPCLLPFEFCTASSHCCTGSCQIYPYPVAHITVCTS